MKMRLFGIFLLMQGALFASETAEEIDAYLKQLPKAELHLHLGGSYPKEFLFSISTPEQQAELEKNLGLVAKGVDYHSVFRVFQIIGQLVNSEEKIQKGTEALCAALQEDGVSYVEIRTGLKNLGQGTEAYLNAVLAGINASSSADFEAKLILSLQRNSSLKAARETVDLALKYQAQGIVGIDISGDSTIGQVEMILPELLRAKEAGLSFVIHVGESPAETDQMQLLEALQPARIGHGVHLSAEAKEWVLTHRVPLEVCLTSSVLVQMIERYDQHPGIELFRQGHPIVFCTDDPLLFSTALSKELLIARKIIGLSREDIERVSKDAFEYVLKPIATQKVF